MAASDYTNPVVDSIAAGRLLAPKIMNNIVQRRQLHDGRGVTEEFSKNVNAHTIRIVRVKPLTQDARRLSSNGALNGGVFNSGTPEQPTTEQYGLDINNVIDLPIDIGQVSLDMIPLDYLNKTAYVLEQKVAKNINASTLAEQLAKALNYQYGDGTTKVDTHRVDIALATDSVVDKLIDMGVVLDDGDPDNGVDAFPDESRAVQLRPAVVGKMKQAGKAVFNLDNWKGQDMLKLGKIDYDTIPNTVVDGYQGMINGVEVYKTSTAVWTLAEGYLGLTAGDLQYIYGVMSAAEGTGRGIAFTHNVVIGQSPRGQGVRMYPLYRWGVETWFEKSIVLLTDDTSFVSVGTGTLSAIPKGSQA